MLEGIIALVVIGTIGYFMWQKSKKPTEKSVEPEAPYKVEVAAPVAPTLVVDGPSDVKEVKPKAKKDPAAKKPKIEKAKAVKAATDPKPKAPKKPNIKIAK